MLELLAGQRSRLLVGVLLLGLLGASLVWAGATPGDPLESEYPTEVEVTPMPEAYVGEQVVLGGRVVETGPVVIATRASGHGQFTLVDATDQLRNVDGSLEVGDRVTAFGTLEDDSTLAVEHGLTQEPSATRYMYVVSAIGGLWVAGRFFQGWRFDRATLAFVPRDRPLGVRTLLGGDRSRDRQRPQRTDRTDRTDRADRARDADERPPLKHRDRRVSAADGGERRG